MQPDDLALTLDIHRNSTYRGHAGNAGALALLRQVASSQRYGQSPTNWRSRITFTRSSISLDSLMTVLSVIPASPIACTRSSTRRVEPPPIQAFWITATRAFSDVGAVPGYGGESKCPGAVCGSEAPTCRVGHEAYHLGSHGDKSCGHRFARALIKPSTSVSISTCITASATLRRMLPSPALANSSADG